MPLCPWLVRGNTKLTNSIGAVGGMLGGGMLGKLLGGSHGSSSGGQGGGYGGGYPPQQQVVYAQQPQKPKRGMGPGAGLALGAGAGLLGGFLVADAIEDYGDERYDQGM